MIDTSTQQMEPHEEAVAVKTTIHFIFPSASGKVKSRGLPNQAGVVTQVIRTFDIACCPGAALPKHASGEAGAVTCLKCIASQPYKDAMSDDGGSDDGSPQDSFSIPVAGTGTVPVVSTDSVASTAPSIKSPSTKVPAK